MADSHRVTVLLADEDSLRRDGLALVLRENQEIDVLSGYSDGQIALEKIRELRPDVAVVDLNLPGLHGIELVRRVRGEGLGTKMIILSGSTDDDIVREVVRAGADAYLLKNGPSRHLTDAINYVRDGGQYFSPQLHRDGRDRHLLEEPPRAPADGAYRKTDDDRAYRDAEGDGASREEPAGRPQRERYTRPRTSDPGRFRERIREQAGDLRDRDYDIMAEMADGIRPILDRLDEIEGRVSEMEVGAEPVPEDPRGWLSEQLTESLGGSRSSQDRRAGSYAARDMEARLPQLIEEAVTKRFQSLAGKLQEQIEEQHVRTLETFVKNIQVKLVQRVSLLEHNMQHQAEAMHELREYNQRTEDNLSRLISGVDRLATELPRRLAAAQQVEGAELAGRGIKEIGAKENRAAKPSGSAKRKNLAPKIFWAAVVVAGLCVGAYEIRSNSASSDTVKTPPVGKELQTPTQNTIAAPSKSALPAEGADTKTKMDAARQYMDRKDYPTAEDIYRQVVQAEPANKEALKGLASVLYREDKIEESTAVLERIPKD